MSVIGGSLQDQLLAVADVLELRGRCQGQLVNGSGQVCLLMAICEVIGNVTATGGSQRVQTIVDVLRAEIGSAAETETITKWNDMPGRTDAEVLTMIRTAAAKAGRPAGVS